MSTFLGTEKLDMKEEIKQSPGDCYISGEALYNDWHRELAPICDCFLLSDT